MLTCSNCAKESTDMDANFCSNCGTAYPQEQKIPLVGQPLSRGIFNITYPVIEEEFDNMDLAYDIASQGTWDGDSNFFEQTEEPPNVVFVRTTVGIETHPYICAKCHYFVTNDITGKCNGCGEQNWVEREKEK